MSDKSHLEEGTKFAPQYDEKGLIACITVSVHTGTVLMYAFMNEQSLTKTLETGEMHYWSRSRKKLWHKGATSGHVQKVEEIMVDCDQDCLLAKVSVTGEEIACHTGRQSCFYRSLDKEKQLIFKDQ